MLASGFAGTYLSLAKIELRGPTNVRHVESASEGVGPC